MCEYFEKPLNKTMRQYLSQKNFGFKFFMKSIINSLAQHLTRNDFNISYLTEKNNKGPLYNKGIHGETL